ncbi:MAG: hypothetical protein MHM6MM_000960 [Cercozoa sp. M6MM]
MTRLRRHAGFFGQSKLIFVGRGSLHLGELARQRGATVLKPRQVKQLLSSAQVHNIIAVADPDSRSETNRKLEEFLKHGVTIVSNEWFHNSVEQRQLLPVDQYAHPQSSLSRKLKQQPPQLQSESAAVESSLKHAAAVNADLDESVSLSQSAATEYETGTDSDESMQVAIASTSDDSDEETDDSRPLAKCIPVPLLQWHRQQRQWVQQRGYRCHCVPFACTCDQCGARYEPELFDPAAATRGFGLSECTWCRALHTVQLNNVNQQRPSQLKNLPVASADSKDSVRSITLRCKRCKHREMHQLAANTEQLQSLACANCKQSFEVLRHELAQALAMR